METTISHTAYHPSSEHKAKLSALNKGKHLSPEHKAKISIANRGHLMSAEIKAKLFLANKGRTLSPETKGKLSLAHKGMQFSPEHRRRLSESHKGKRPTAETLAKRSIALKGENHPLYGKHHSPEALKRMSASHKGFKHSPESKAKISLALKGRHLPPGQVSRLLALHKQQTKPERVIESILEELCPHEYKYVGCDGSILLNHCVPDFINTNGQKKVIEVFGDYWHGKKYTGRTREQEEVRKLNQYAEVGFDCLIIWENETNNTAKVKKRIKAFGKMKHFKNQPYLV